MLKGRAALHPRQKRIDERRLAGTAVAGDEDHLAFSPRRGGQGTAEPAELCGVADEDGRRRDLAIDREGVPVAGAVVPVPLVPDKTKATPVHRLDEARAAGVVAERDAQLADRLADAPVGHGRVGPHGGEQVFLGDELPGPLGQVAENREGFTPEGDDLHSA
jgi:hypothetical protein